MITEEEVYGKVWPGVVTNLSGLIAGYELRAAAHENTTPNYRKDVLQMSDMLT